MRLVELAQLQAVLLERLRALEQALHRFLERVEQAGLPVGEQFVLVVADGARHVHELLVEGVDAQKPPPKAQHLAVRHVAAAVDDLLLHVLHAVLHVGEVRQVVLHEQLHELEQAVRRRGFLQNADALDVVEQARAYLSLVDEDEVGLVQVKGELERLAHEVPLVGNGERADEAVGEHVEVGALGLRERAQRRERVGAGHTELGELLGGDDLHHRCPRLDGLVERHGFQLLGQHVFLRHGCFLLDGRRCGRLRRALRTATRQLARLLRRNAGAACAGCALHRL